MQAQNALLELERIERNHAAEDPRYRLAHLALRGAQAFVLNDLPKTKCVRTGRTGTLET